MWRYESEMDVARGIPKYAGVSISLIPHSILTWLLYTLPFFLIFSLSVTLIIVVSLSFLIDFRSTGEK